MKRWSAKLRDYTIGAVVATTFLASTSVFGAPALKSIDAVFNNIKVVVDGITIQPKDSDGKPVEPFIVDGTTYLPLRAVATAFGKPVSWDQQTSTVIIGNNPKVSGRIIPLQELIPYEGGESFTNREKLNSFNAYQETYQPAVNDFYASRYSRQSYEWVGTYYHDFNVTYLLKGNYTILKAKFAADDSDTSISNIKIYGDGKELYSGTASRGEAPKNIELNVTGINQLIIEGSINFNGHFYDVTLTEIEKK